MKKTLLFLAIVALNTLPQASTAFAEPTIVEYGKLKSIEPVTGPAILEIDALFSPIQPLGDESTSSDLIAPSLITEKLPQLTVVRTHEMYLREGEWKALIAALRGTATLTSLDLSGLHLPDDECRTEMFSLIGSTPSLQHVGLVNCGLTTDNILSLGIELLKLPSLSAIDVSENSLDTVGLTNFMTMLTTKLSTLKRFSIAIKDLGDNFKVVVPLFATMSALEELSIHGCVMSDKFLQSLGSLRSLRKLHIHSYNVNSKELANLLIILKEIDCKKLVLSNLHLTSSSTRDTLSSLIGQKLLPGSHFRTDYNSSCSYYLSCFRIAVKHFMPDDFVLDVTVKTIDYG